MSNQDRMNFVRRVDPGAIEEYEARTLKKATNAREVDVFAPEGILTELGPVHAITYKGTLQGDTELYEHTFIGKAQPDLMVDARNTLHLVGGDYHVADVGIVDGPGEHRVRNPRSSNEMRREVFSDDDTEGDDLLGVITYRDDDRGGSAWIAQVIGGYSRPFFVQDHGSFLGAANAAEGWILKNAGRKSNPVKDDGKWHRVQGDQFGTWYAKIAKGTSIIRAVIKYQPRKYPETRFLENVYESQHYQRIPSGAAYIGLVAVQGAYTTTVVTTAHKTLAGAKKAADKLDNPKNWQNFQRSRSTRNPWEKTKGKSYDGESIEWAKYDPEKLEEAKRKLERAKAALEEAVEYGYPASPYPWITDPYTDLESIGNRISAFIPKDTRPQLSMARVFPAGSIPFVSPEYPHAVATDGKTLAILPVSDDIGVSLVQSKRYPIDEVDPQAVNVPDVSQVIPRGGVSALFALDAVKKLIPLSKALARYEKEKTGRPFEPIISIEAYKDESIALTAVAIVMDAKNENDEAVALRDFSLVSDQDFSDGKQAMDPGPYHTTPERAEARWLINPDYLKAAIDENSLTIQISVRPDEGGLSAIRVEADRGELHVIMPLAEVRYVERDDRTSAKDNPKEKPFSRAPLGSGGRFAACVAKMSRRGNVKDPKALCASIGRKKYGAKKMASMARAGKRNPSDRIEGDEGLMEFWLDLTDPFYIQLAEQAPDGGLHHVWLQTAREVIANSDQPELESYKTIESSLDDTGGEWVDLPGQPGYVWRKIDRVMVPFIERTESTDVIEKWQIREMDSKLYSFNFSTAEADTIINALRSYEHKARDEEIRLMARQLKGLFYDVLNEGKERRSRNPVVTNRVSPNSPIRNAGSLAAPLPGGYAGYGYPKVNAGVMALPSAAPSPLDYPRAVNGSHGLLGPQIQRNVPGQPIANPVMKQDGRWHRSDTYKGTRYYLHAGDSFAYVTKYEPRKDPRSVAAAEMYEGWHRQTIPKGTKWISYTVHKSPLAPYRSEGGYGAHKTLAAAKRAAEKELKSLRKDVEAEEAKRAQFHSHTEAMSIMESRYPDWNRGDLLDTVRSVSVTMGPERERVQEEYQRLRGFIE